MAHDGVKTFVIRGQVTGIYEEEIEAETEEEALEQFQRWGPSMDMDLLNWSIDSIEEGTGGES